MSFLDLLHEKLTDIDLEVASLDATPNLSSKKRYNRYMRDCYDSLGRYVSMLQVKKSIDHFVQIEYMCLLMPLPTLRSMVDYFMNLKEPTKVLASLIEKQSGEQGTSLNAKKLPPEIDTLQNRIKDLGLASQRMREFAQENIEAKTCKESNVFILFGKKRAGFSLDRILKNTLAQAERFFASTPLETSGGSPSLREDIKRRQELLESMSGGELKLAALLRDYLRNIDLNYIDASRSYYNDKFTFTDLLRRDRVNKKFTRTDQIHMGGDSGPQYSAELAAEYLLHKIEELDEDIVLATKINSQLKVETLGVTHIEELENPEESNDNSPGLPFSVISSIGRLANLVEEDPFSFNSDSTYIPGQTNSDSKLVSMLNLIMTENKVAIEYLKKLLSTLSRQKTFLDSRYINPFDSSIKYGQTALEQIAAFRFTENALNCAKGLSFRIAETISKLDLLIGEEPELELGSSAGFLEYTKSSVLGHIVILL